MLTSCCSLFPPPKEEGDILKLVIVLYVKKTGPKTSLFFIFIKFRLWFPEP